jgi:hypothetical protein
MTSKRRPCVRQSASYINGKAPTTEFGAFPQPLHGAGLIAAAQVAMIAIDLTAAGSSGEVGGTFKRPSTRIAAAGCIFDR